jgi:hypothetical protein
MQKYPMLVLIICFDLLVASLVFAYQDGDWQFWSSGSVQGDLAESWMVRLEQQFRLGDNMAELYYHCTDIGVTWKASSRLKFGWNYAQLYQKKKGMWTEENRPHVNGAFLWEWYGFKFEDRNRLERRFREGAGNIWMYRNKFELGFPAKLTRLDIQPYLAEEIFVNLDESELYRNRVSGGIKGRLAPYLKADISYLWQSTKSSENWIDNHVIGAKLQASM